MFKEELKTQLLSSTEVPFFPKVVGLRLNQAGHHKHAEFSALKVARFAMSRGRQCVELSKQCGPHHTQCFLSHLSSTFQGN